MRRFTPIAGTLIVLVACTQQESRIVGPAGPRGSPVDATPSVVSETSSDLWARIITGETGPGSSYQLYLPRQWNGTAVFYAHGIRDVLDPVGWAADAEPSLRAFAGRPRGDGVGRAFPQPV